MSYRPLNRIAQEAIGAVLGDGDLAIDATVGNGADTRFLAAAVAPSGRVIGFDIQADALRKTAAMLQAADLAAGVELLHAGHQQMHAHVPADWHGRVAAVMFNLGYLPGGDKALVTAPETTLAGLDQAMRLLRPGGLLSVMVYRGHSGGMAEATAVDAWLDAVDGDAAVTRHDSPGPRLYLVARPRPAV